MPNRLQAEPSPYLRQHAENPVDWFPWGAEAFERAAREDKPVFLSVGYSACHWCHVMAHESFEDEETARLMNEHFVSVKVDREERPDVDAIYMDAVHALTGRGGWPMSVFLTPEGLPFYGGTYFPPRSRFGMPAFSEILRKVSELWDTKRGDLEETGALLKDALSHEALPGAEAHDDELQAGQLDAAVRQLAQSFDAEFGGWGNAPKFPQPAVPEFVLRRYVATGDEQLLAMVTTTLDGMMHGGIYDQLGGGFHRYSTDERWLVPHFEKMLYDNAQLARVYLHAWQVTGNPGYRRVVTETLDYLLREMSHPSGGFYSAQDADTGGEEGAYFTWAPDQLALALLGTDAEEDAELVASAYGVVPGGNFEGKTVLSVAKTPAELGAEKGMTAEEVERRLERARAVLVDARECRERPGLDDKVLAGWNGLALSAFAEAAAVLERDDYRAAAERTAGFLLEEMRVDDRLLRSWTAGHARGNGFLEDYAACAQGLLDLYETTFEVRWFTAARELAESVLAHFADESGGFFDTSDDHEALFLRPKEVQDGAIPSGSAIISTVLLRLALLSGEARYAERARAAIRRVQSALGQVPLGTAGWLSALDLAVAPPRTLAIVGHGIGPMVDVVRQRWRPNLVVAADEDPEGDGEPELLLRQPRTQEPTAYLCRDFTCERPVHTTAELAGLLAGT